MPAAQQAGAGCSLPWRQPFSDHFQWGMHKGTPLSHGTPAQAGEVLRAHACKGRAASGSDSCRQCSALATSPKLLCMREDSAHGSSVTPSSTHNTVQRTVRPCSTPLLRTPSAAARARSASRSAPAVAGWCWDGRIVGSISTSGSRIRVVITAEKLEQQADVAGCPAVTSALAHEQLTLLHEQLQLQAEAAIPAAVGALPPSKPDKLRVRSGHADSLPYCDMSEAACFAAAPEAVAATDTWPCKICAQDDKPKDMRHHVAAHIHSGKGVSAEDLPLRLLRGCQRWPGRRLQLLAGQGYRSGPVSRGHMLQWLQGQVQPWVMRAQGQQQLGHQGLCNALQQHADGVRCLWAAAAGVRMEVQHGMHYALRHVGQALPPRYKIGPLETNAMTSKASRMQNLAQTALPRAGGGVGCKHKNSHSSLH